MNFISRVFGSNAQYPWYAPFKFWRFKMISIKDNLEIVKYSQEDSIFNSLVKGSDECYFLGERLNIFDKNLDSTIKFLVKQVYNSNRYKIFLSSMMLHL